MFVPVCQSAECVKEDWRGDRMTGLNCESDAWAMYEFAGAKLKL